MNLFKSFLQAVGSDPVLISADSLLLSAGVSVPCQCPSGHLGAGEMIYKHVFVIMHCSTVGGRSEWIGLRTSCSHAFGCRGRTTRPPSREAVSISRSWLRLEGRSRRCAYPSGERRAALPVLEMIRKSLCDNAELLFSPTLPTVLLN